MNDIFRRMMTIMLLGGLVTFSFFPHMGNAEDQTDAETGRYQAEMQRIGISGSMFDIQSRAFATARPDKRVKMWADLETVRKELAKEDMQKLLEIRAQTESTSAYDAETLSYKATLEKAGKSAEDVNGLVTLFSISKPLVRQVLWDGIRVQPQ